MTTEELLNALLKPAYVYRMTSGMQGQWATNPDTAMARSVATRRRNALTQIDALLRQWATTNVEAEHVDEAGS